jgi:predicted porin
MEIHLSHLDLQQGDLGGLWKSTSSLALLAAAGMYLGSAGMSPAKAADLGGDCCADLEERVAELEATTVRKGNRRVSLTLSGQVSTSVMAWSDGNTIDGSDAYVVDNVMAGGTFFQLAGSARINPNLSAGFQVTMALETGSRSHQVNQLDDDATPSTDLQPTITLANWYLDHKQLGRVTVGRINTATAGITTIDLGGAGVIANASIGYTQRGFFLALDDVLIAGKWTDVLGGGPVNGASLSRANAVSYTTPTFGGFSASAAWGEDDIWDVALRYAGEFGGFRVAAGIGYINNSTGLTEVTKDHAVGPEPNQIKGSASVLHVASGLFLTGAHVHSDTEIAGRPDIRLWYLQGGVSKNWTGLGNTVLYGEWARVDDGINCGAGACGAFGGNAGDIINDSRATMWGIGVVQHIDAAAMELFLSYKRFSAEVTSPVGNLLNGTVEYNDFDVVIGGARIRF